MKAKFPALMFYTGDWLKDPEVSKCSPATRGIFIDALCAMHESGMTGTLSGTADQLVRVLRCSMPELQSAIAELKITQAADVTERNGLVTLVSRRMSRDYKKRVGNMLRQETHRKKKTVTPPSQQNNGVISISYSTSEDKERENGSGCATTPTLQEVLTWGQMDCIPATDCEAFFLHYDGLGWMNGNTPISNPRQWLKKWMNRGRRPMQWAVKPGENGGAAQQSNPAPAKRLSVWEAKQKLEVVEEEIQKILLRGDSYEGRDTPREADKPRYRELKQKRQELKKAIEEA